MKFSHDRAEPFEEVQLTVETTADSFVGLMAVDQSVKLLKSGNDITYELVIFSYALCKFPRSF